MPEMESSMLTLEMFEPHTQTTYTYTYNPRTCAIYNPDGERCSTDHLKELVEKNLVCGCRSKKVHEMWRKDNDPSHLRISIGQACNYRCKYCVQEHETVLHEEITEETIKEFAHLVETYIDPKDLFMVQFWGGEPFLYGDRVFTLMKYLYPILGDVKYFTLTNGSLLTKEIVDKCIEHHITLGLSHDGPGQIYRSGDPLAEGSTSREALLYYWDKIQKKEIESDFNIVSTTTDKFIQDLPATEKYFTDIFGEEILTRINAFSLIVDSPDQLTCTIPTRSEDQIPFNTFKYLFKKGMSPAIFIPLVFDWLELFMKKDLILDDNQVSCFLASSGALTLDLHGNVFPCQNYCIKSSNGEYPHLMGHISDLQHLVFPQYKRLKDKSTKCINCPVVTMCMGGCPLSAYTYKDANCRGNFTFYMGLLSYILYLITGCVLTNIDGDFPCRDI